MAMAAAECVLPWRPQQHSSRRTSTSKPCSSRTKLPCCVASGHSFGAAARPDDPFLASLAAAARTPRSSVDRAEGPPLLDIVSDPAVMAVAGSGSTTLDDVCNPILMAAPAHVETSYNEHRPRKPPPDLPSLLLNSRIVYIGMPLVPAVTELVIAELLFLQYSDSKQPIYMYINSTGTSRADGETVGMETEGFAIHDTMQLVKNEIHTVGIGAAIGQACLLLAAGKKGKRYMLPHATAMIQQPRMPSMGQMPAIDLHIRAKEVVNNRDTLVKLLARHTGNPVEKVAKVMRRPFYMSPKKALEFGVVDTILWRGQEAMGETLSPEEWDKRAGIRPVERSV